MFISELRPGEVVIDESNYREHIPAHTGYIAPDPSNPVYAAASDHLLPFDLPLIPREQWKERIAEMEAKKTRLSDLLIYGKVPQKDQNPTNYCWIFSPVTAMEAVRCVMGLPYISLSPASVGGPIKNYKDQGGWGREGIQYIGDHGVAPTSMWPDKGQNKKYNTPEVQEARKRFKVTEWMILKARNMEQLMTCLFNRIPVSGGYNWMSHQVTPLDPIIMPNGSFGVRYRDNYAGRNGPYGFKVFGEPKCAPDDGVAPRVATAANT